MNKLGLRNYMAQILLSWRQLGFLRDGSLWTVSNTFSLILIGDPSRPPDKEKRVWDL
jgi:hypothetical protein